MRAAPTAALVYCGFLLTGCGTAVIKPDGAARSVADLVSRKTGFHPTDVRCPSGVPATVGGRFECHFTGPGNDPYTAFMRIVKVQGPRVLFHIRTRPDR
jgi:hypothetical protein